MRSQVPGDARKLWWSHSKRSDPSGDDDALASHSFPVHQNHSETRRVLFDFGDPSRFQVGNGMGLKPATVGNKTRNGDGPAYGHATRRLERIDRQ
jgi:hypothetical protein